MKKKQRKEAKKSARASKNSFGIDYKLVSRTHSNNIAIQHPAAAAALPKKYNEILVKREKPDAHEKE